MIFGVAVIIGISWGPFLATCWFPILGWPAVGAIAGAASNAAIAFGAGDEIGIKLCGIFDAFLGARRTSSSLPVGTPCLVTPENRCLQIRRQAERSTVL